MDKSCSKCHAPAVTPSGLCRLHELRWAFCSPIDLAKVLEMSPKKVRAWCLAGEFENVERTLSGRWLLPRSLLTLAERGELAVPGGAA
jgi:hypothetical protein